MELLDENFIALAIWECLKNNDPEGVMEIIQAHLELVILRKYCPVKKSGMDVGAKDFLREIRVMLAI